MNKSPESSAIESLRLELQSTFERERLFREDHSQLLMAEMRRYIDKRLNDFFSQRLPLVMTPGSPIYTHTNDGHRIFLDPSEPFISLHVLEHGEWEKPVRRVFRELLSEGASFVDIGANIGLHALLATKLVGPTGKVLLLEPHPLTAKYLRDNFEINGLENRVTIIEAAAAEVDGGTRRFEYFPEHSAMSGFKLPKERKVAFRGSAQSIKVPVVSVDGLLAKHKLIPDVIKIDVEGFELHVLQGAAKLLASSADTAFIIEHSPELAASLLGKNAPDQILKAFDVNGFRGYLIQENGCRPLEDGDYDSNQGDIVFVRRNSKRLEKISMIAK